MRQALCDRARGSFEESRRTLLLPVQAWERRILTNRLRRPASMSAAFNLVHLLACCRMLIEKYIVAIGDWTEEVLRAVSGAPATYEGLLELFPALVVCKGGVARHLPLRVADERRVVLILTNLLRTGDALSLHGWTVGKVTRLFRTREQPHKRAESQARDDDRRDARVDIDPWIPYQFKLLS